jgi:hypothetical protein
VSAAPHKRLAEEVADGGEDGDPAGGADDSHGGDAEDLPREIRVLGGCFVEFEFAGIADLAKVSQLRPSVVTDNQYVCHVPPLVR